MKKKVLVLTRHAIANYGSLLQAIATQRIIEKCGYECKIIDYIRSDEYKNKSLITAAKQKSYVKKFPFLLYFYYLARLAENTYSNDKFELMRKRWLPMTELFHELSSPPFADIYMTGSDQVWGPLMNGKYDWNYFLAFVRSEAKKVAYAASFGKMDISSDEIKRMIPFWEEYDNITVRERQGLELLENNNIHAEQVVDPTLLFSGDDWRSLFKTSSRKDKGKYVLVYQIHKSDRLNRFAKEFAINAGLPLRRVAVMHHQRLWSGKFIGTPDVKEFIEYIDNAAYVVTDSFHGTAFSINLNTPFVTLMPETGTSSRNISLLELTELTHFIAKDENDFSVLKKNVDFSKANQILARERDRSIEVLKNILSDI